MKIMLTVSVLLLISNLCYSQLLSGDSTFQTSVGTTLRFRLNVQDINNLRYQVHPLPKNAALDSIDGSFYWKPDYTQFSRSPYILTFMLIDTNGVRINSKKISITVNEDNHQPSLIPIGDKSVALNQRLEFIVKGLDDDGDQLRYSMNGNIPAANIDPESGKFQWTADEDNGVKNGDKYFVTFSVADMRKLNVQTSEKISIEVIDKPVNPVLDKDIFKEEKSLYEGEILEFIVSATDKNGGNLIYSIISPVTPLPGDVFLFESHTGLFRWIPPYTYVNSQNESRILRIKFKVMDPTLRSDTAELKIKIIDAQNLISLKEKYFTTLDLSQKLY